MRLKYMLFISVLALLLPLSDASAAKVRIGVLAKNGPTKALRQWGPTGEYLTRKMAGQQVEIIPLDFDKVNPAVKNNDVDFFLVNSSMFVTAKLRYGASAVATMINARQGQALDSFGGVILTRSYRNDINSLADLKGKKFAGVKRSSFGGWQMAYKLLMDHRINPFRDFTSLQFSGKHDSVVFAIRNELVDAGTVRTDTLERMALTGTIVLDDFKIINEQHHDNFPFVCSTPLYPEWPMAKTAATSPELASELARALKGIRRSDRAARRAKIIGWTDPLDYSPVEELQKTLHIGGFAK
jgi:twitching motility protein PilJ